MHARRSETPSRGWTGHPLVSECTSGECGAGSRGVRLVFESGRPVAQVARELEVHAEALRSRVRRAEARGDMLLGADRQRLVELERESAELRQADEILRAASV
jgi:transposase-like protein